MTGLNGQPPFMLHVVWHPEYARGREVADLLREHFGSDRYKHLEGGSGVRVMFRHSAAPNARTPIPVDWDSTETAAAVVLLDLSLVNDAAWVEYLRNLVREAATRGFRARVYPVEMEDGALDIPLVEQALRWAVWAGGVEERQQRLIRTLTYEFSRMLRNHLAQLQQPSREESLDQYLRSINVFLSHSKRDDSGEPVAESIRNWLHENSALSTFLDVRDIPPGVSFSDVIDHSIENSVLVAIYTDSYSSREWCRREVIKAKRLRVPMLVVDCLQTFDLRAFPYMANVPFVRIDPERRDRIDLVEGLLLDEVFKDFLWRCRIESLHEAHPQTTFLARPPELVTLADFPGQGGESEPVIVYPDPPLGTEEGQLFYDVAQEVRLYSLTQWLAEV